MLYTNGFGAAVILVIMIGTGEAFSAAAYFAGSPSALALLAVRSATFLAGALAFTALIKQFGTGAATAVGTARKSITVMLSLVAFPKPFHVNYAYGAVAFIAADMIFLWLKAKRSAEAHTLPKTIR